jgi:hypothetical protein
MAASYLDFFSVAACGLLSIPIAVAYLSKAELGIWAIVNGLISYLVWLDLGLGTASARMIAPSIGERNQDEINRWWTLSRGIMVVLGLVGAGLCLLAIPLFFFVYDVPAELASDTRTLLLGAAAIIAVSIPLRGVSGLEDSRTNKHSVGAELHHHGRIGGCCHAARSKQNNGKRSRAGDLLYKGKGCLQFFGGNVEFILGHGRQSADLAINLANVLGGF